MKVILKSAQLFYSIAKLVPSDKPSLSLIIHGHEYVDYLLITTGTRNGGRPAYNYDRDNLNSGWYFLSITPVMLSITTEYVTELKAYVVA